MDIIPKNEVFQADKRNTKKRLLITDAICLNCGVIFNSKYEEQCIICDTPIAECNDIKEKNTCQHEEFIIGRESVDLRILLDYNIEDLKSISELHGCAGGSRGKMAICIMKKLHPSLDRRINESLVRKMIKRNNKKFRFLRNIEDAIKRAKKTDIALIDADECIEIIDMPDTR